MRSARIQEHYGIGAKMPDHFWLLFRPRRPDEDIADYYRLLDLRPPEEVGAPCLVDDPNKFIRRLSSP
jgi:hypothetical protein